jgi:urate oxidase
MSDLIELKDNRYGKSGVRVMKVERRGFRHELKDIDINIQLLGAFEAAYREGDNKLVLPTDTMKNTVYAFARREHLGEIEEFGLSLADHFLLSHSHVSRVHIVIYENFWQRIERHGAPHDHAFKLSGAERRATVIDRDRVKKSIKAIITDLALLKTAQSAFENFLRDEYTTLKEARDRIFSTTVRAEWSYNSQVRNYGELWSGVRSTLLDVFATHDSRSVQHTLYAMGEAVLQRYISIDEIHLSMPNLHCQLVDLSPFNIDNPNEVFVPTDEPNGLIEATLIRSNSW